MSATRAAVGVAGEALPEADSVSLSAHGHGTRRLFGCRMHVREPLRSRGQGEVVPIALGVTNLMQTFSC